MEEKVSESDTICRLCGKVGGPTQPIFEPPSEKNLPRDLNFYLPLEVRFESHFPRVICSKCLEDFSVVSTFFVTLNEGQALLAEQLLQKENIFIPMTNFFDGKKSIFSTKYPSKPKNITGGKRSHQKKQSLKPTSETFNPPQDLGPGKRTRRLPKRLEESVQGHDLEKIFKPEDTTFEKVVVSPVQNQSLLIKGNLPKTNNLQPTATQKAVIDENRIITLNVDASCQMEEFGQMFQQLQSETFTEGKIDSGIRSTHEESVKKPTFKTRLRNQCDICLKNFKSAKRLSFHKSNQHSDLVFVCGLESCGEQFKTRSAILLHKKLAGHNQEFELIGAHKEKQNLTKSIVSESKLTQVRFQCGECGTYFNIKENLESHLVSNHQSQHLFRCDVCDLNLPNRASYKDHSISVHGIAGNEYKCGRCEKFFYHHVNLEHHQQNDHANQTFACQQCSKIFRAKSLLKRHLSCVHEDSESRLFACQVCDIKFKSAKNLRVHLISHSEEKKFQCEVCQKQFSYKTSLIQHVKLHQGSKPFKCQHCGKGFSQNGNLQEHSRIHTGDKPFVCSICGARFTTSSQHKLHEKRHRGERPWKCDSCPKAFLHKDAWTSHIRRHKGEKPFSCAVCQKCFTEVWALKKHSRLHTGEKPFSCSVCQKSFSDSSNLKKHFLGHQKQNTLNQDMTGQEKEVKLTSDDFGQGKDVWNVIQFESASNQNSDFVLESSDLQVSNFNQDQTEHIIYIAYEPDEKPQIVQILDNNMVDPSPVSSSQQDVDASIDLSHLSQATRIQLEASVSGTVDQAKPNPDIQLSDSLQIIAEGEESGVSLENAILCSDLDSLDNNQHQAQVDHLDEGGYVDVTTKEGELIRLKVPFNIHPVI